MSKVSIISLKNLNYWVWSSIINMLKSDEIAFTYLIYDLVYELSNTNAYFLFRDSVLKAFLLIWKDAVHLWGNDDSIDELIKFIPVSNRERVYIQTYDDDVASKVLDYVRPHFDKVEVNEFIDMIVSKDNFKPYKPELATRLCRDNDDHLKQLAEILTELLGRKLSIEEIKNTLSVIPYYGVFINGELVSIANAYVRTRDLWLVGSVYTKPSFRGRGYAKAVTSAVTALALSTGAKAALHVRYGNEPAIKAYRRIGYKELRKRKWIICRNSS